MQIKRRHIVYVQGYDPRGLAQYYRMFRTELRKFLALYGLKADVTRPGLSDDNARARWMISTEGDDWKVETTYDFLRWEDVIARDFARPSWWVVGNSLLVLGNMIFSGILCRFFRAQWRFALFVIYPFVVFFAQIAVSVLAGYAVSRFVANAGIAHDLARLAGAIVALALFALLVKFTERRTFMLYLMNDIISTYQFGAGRRKDWDARMRLFAEHLVEVTRECDADELIVIGHSSGSFLAVTVLAQALELDPELGRRKPRVRLLTLGSNFPIVGFVRRAAWFRDQLRQLAIEPGIDWIDYQSRKDVMNFFGFDPIAGHGIDPGELRRNPTVAIMSVRHMIDPAIYSKFRWRFFRVHFQFIMANDRPDPYDFFMMLCGPIDLVSRVGAPADALAALTATGDARRAARARLGLGDATTSSDASAT